MESSNIVTPPSATNVVKKLRRRRYKGGLDKTRRNNISVTQINQSTDLNVNKPCASVTQSSLLKKQAKVKLYANATTQRLDKKNISEIFLVQTRKPIKLPTLEVLKLPELPVINKKKEMLTQIAKFKAAKEKAKERAKLYLAARKKKFLRRIIRNQLKGIRRSNTITSSYAHPYGSRQGREQGYFRYQEKRDLR